MSITLYTYKNDTLSFVTKALVLTKLQFLTQNTHIYTSEIKNGPLVAPKSAFYKGASLPSLQQWHLKCYWLNFGNDKTTISSAKYIHTYTSQMIKW